MAHVQRKQTSTGERRYEVRWREPGGRHRTKGGFRTKAEAEAFLLDIANRLRSNGAYVDPSAGRALFRDYAKTWLAGKVKLKVRTREGYAKMLRDGSELDEAFGRMPLDSIQRSDVQAWVSRLVARGAKPTTVRNPFYVIRQVMEQAVADRLIATSPCEHIELPTARNQKDYDNERRFLTADQVECLADELPFPWRLAVLLSPHSGGLRAGELWGLQVGDLDLRRETLTVRRTVIARAGGWDYDSPKTRESRRTVPMPLDDELALHLARHPRRDDAEAPLFPMIGRSGSEPDWTRPMRHSSFVGRVFRPALKEAGLPTDLRFHDLRHTFASLRADEGWSAQQIAEWMGHANVVTTLSIYTHLFRPDHSDVVMKLKASRASARTVTGDNVVPMRR